MHGNNHVLVKLIMHILLNHQKFNIATMTLLDMENLPILLLFLINAIMFQQLFLVILMMDHKKLINYNKVYILDKIADVSKPLLLILN